MAADRAGLKISLKTALHRVKISDGKATGALQARIRGYRMSESNFPGFTSQRLAGRQLYGTKRRALAGPSRS